MFSATHPSGPVGPTRRLVRTVIAKTEQRSCYPVRPMSDYREVIHERLYVRVPGTDKLRKTAANREKHLLANGWRETERNQTPDYIQVRFERTGHAPMRARLPRHAPEIVDRRPRRDGQGGRGRR
jgi:hypothetical protein